MFKKNASVKERAHAALANLQRNAYAMSMLRSRIESRISFALCHKSTDSQELGRVLELVKNGELILREMSEKIESTRFLEEFTIIMNSAASSVSEIKDDLEQMVPAAEAALEEMHDAISKVSTGIPAGAMEQGIFAEVAAALAADKAVEPVVEVQAAKEGQEPEPVPA